MEQEDQAQRATSSSGNIIIGSKSHNGKRSKQKKVPQRGLGVAQLERIRLEEQQKKSSNHHDYSNRSSSSSSCPLNTSFIYQLNSSTFRPNHLAHEIPRDYFNVPKVWKTCDHLNLAQEFNPIWPLSNYQQTIPSIMNVSTQCSLSSFQIEPPSNQICYYGNYSSISPDEEKILGNNKRSYPFVDNQPNSSFNFTLNTANSDHSHSKNSRVDLPLCSSNSIPNPKKNSKKSMNENNVPNGNFLALSLPTTLSSKFNTFDSEIHDFETNPFQGIENNTNFEAEPSGSSDIPFYSFFPPPKELNYVYDLAPTSTNYYTNGFDGNVDLNLKL